MVSAVLPPSCRRGRATRGRNASASPTGSPSISAPVVAIRVVDLSTHGFRAATHLELCEGADVWLRLPGLEPYHAKVAWSEGHYIGCAFERPLHPAVVDMIVSKARAG
jgi:hypothetical protein